MTPTDPLQPLEKSRTPTPVSRSRKLRIKCVGGWFGLAAISGCSHTALEHCGSLVSSDYQSVELDQDTRSALLEKVGNNDFPVDSKRGRDEAWFEDEQTLVVCTYEPGLDTCDNKAAALMFTKGPDGWDASETYEISTCARP